MKETELCLIQPVSTFSVHVPCIYLYPYLLVIVLQNHLLMVVLCGCVVFCLLQLGSDSFWLYHWRVIMRLLQHQNSCSTIVGVTVMTLTSYFLFLLLKKKKEANSSGPCCFLPYPALSLFDADQGKQKNVACHKVKLCWRVMIGCYF